jgi:hypothetical protein
MAACLADDMVMMILQLAELILGHRPIGHFKSDSQGLEKIEGSIDGGQTDSSLPFEKVVINL